MITFGDLFAGIGGFSLGFERAGMECKWHVEIEPYCQKVLRKHWPNCGEWDDVRTFPPSPTEDWSVDVICGGFPCQDISNAGKRAGIDGERSGLWRDMCRVVRALRPRVVVVENVAAILGRGLDRVLGDLAEIGYDAEWDCIPAAAVGAPHIRDRLFIHAYANNSSKKRQRRNSGKVLPDEKPIRSHGVCSFLSDHIVNGLQGQRQTESSERERDEIIARSAVAGSYCITDEFRSWWKTESGMGRVADGVSNRVDRLRGLGNAVVPQVAQFIGERIVTACRDRA